MALVTSIEKKTLTLTAGSSSANTTISATDTTNCVPFISYRVSTLPGSSPYDQPPEYMVMAEFLTSPNRIQVSTTGADASRVVVVEACIVEFNDTEATVQSGDITIAAAATSDTDTLSPTVNYVAGDVTDAFAVSTYKGGLDNDNRASSVRTAITATNTISFTRDAAPGSDAITGKYWVVKAVGGSFSTEQATWLMGEGATAQTQSDTTITTISNTAKAMVIASIEGDGNPMNDDNHTVPITYLVDASTLRMKRYFSTAVGIECTAFVVKFTGSENVQRGVRTQPASTPPASETVTITEVTDSIAMAWPVRGCGVCTAAGSSAAGDAHPDVYVALDFASVVSDKTTSLQIKRLVQDPVEEAGPIDISWEVIEWDVTAGGGGGERRVMVVS